MERNGRDFHSRPLRRKFDEVHALAKRDGDAAEDDKTRHNEKTPAGAPADRIADTVDAADEQKTSDRDVHAEKHGENISESPARIRPEPVRERPSPGLASGFSGYPHADDGEEILPASRRFALGGGGQRQRNKNETGNGCGTRERESVCPQDVNQVDKEHCGAEQVAAAGAEARGETFRDAARGKERHHQKEKCECRECSGEGAAAVALPRRRTRLRRELAAAQRPSMGSGPSWRDSGMAR